MARHSRKFTPRQRTKRPLGVSITSNATPKVPHDTPIEYESRWLIKPPLSARLYQKSGLGVVTGDDGIVLSSMEVLFCNWHRHLPLPSEDWFELEVQKDSDLLAKAVVFDTARSGGELVIPCENVIEYQSSRGAFALKWKRNQSQFKSEPISHVRWFWTFDSLDWSEIFRWADEVEKLNCKSDIFIIDEEMEVTMYRVSFIEPSGSQKVWGQLSVEELENITRMWNSKIITNSGYYLPLEQKWPLNSIGVEHLSGINLRNEEGEWLENMIKGEEISRNSQLYDNLISRGLILRPGFKFGSKWRVYDDEVSKSHAPWLVQTEDEVAKTWENACLSIRLAEGVHKKWVCALEKDSSWKFMQVERWSPGKD